MDMDTLINNLNPNDTAQVKALQQALQAQGYDVTPDGKLGGKTSAAIGKYRAEQNAIAERGLKGRELENQAQERGWQNQAVQAGKYAVIPAGMYGGHLMGKGMEERQMATEAAQRAGAMPNPAQNWSPTRRFAGRMAPYALRGGALAGEGWLLREMVAPHIQNETGREAARVAGTGLAGMGLGVFGTGINASFTPQMKGGLPAGPGGPGSPFGVPQLPGGPGAPGAPMGGPQMPGGGPAGPGLPPPGGPMGGPMGGPPPGGQPPAGPPPNQPPPLRRPSDRLLGAAQAAGAGGKMTKAAAADFLANNITAANRQAVAAELGVKPGPNMAKRIATRIDLLRTSRTPLAIPLAIGAGAYAMGSSDADAAGATPGEARAQGVKDAAAAGGGAAAGSYGLSKLLAKVPALGKALGIGGSMMGPMAAADAYAPSQEEVNRDRNDAVQWMPSWMRVGELENAYQMAQVPERGPSAGSSPYPQAQAPFGMPMPMRRPRF